MDRDKGKPVETRCSRTAAAQEAARMRRVRTMGLRHVEVGGGLRAYGIRHGRTCERPVFRIAWPAELPRLATNGARDLVLSVGKFYLLGHNPKGGLMVHERLFEKAMGIFVEDETIILATLFQILKFENVLKPGQFINQTLRRLLCAAHRPHDRRARRP